MGISRSIDKTSVKNMASAVLSRRGRTLATEGNYNNEIGLPLTNAVRTFTGRPRNDDTLATLDSALVTCMMKFVLQ